MKASGHMTCDEGQWSHELPTFWAVGSMSEEHLGSPQGTSGSHSLEGSQAGSTTPDPCLLTEVVWAETDSVVGSTLAAHELRRRGEERGGEGRRGEERGGEERGGEGRRGEEREGEGGRGEERGGEGRRGGERRGEGGRGEERGERGGEGGRGEESGGEGRTGGRGEGEGGEKRERGAREEEERRAGRERGGRAGD